VRTYLLKVLVTVLAIMAAHYLVLIAVRSPLPAEYWIREFIIVKRYQAAAMPSPKLIFSGGSCTLFGIDAAAVQKSLQMPAINLGLHAAMRLEDHLAEARSAAKSGDIIILSLEPAYYDTYTTKWNTWDLRNALAWDRASLDSLPLMRRWKIYFESSDPSMSWDLLTAGVSQRFFPASVGRRMEALAPEQTIIERYLSQPEKMRTFAYDIDNLDANGDLLNIRNEGPPFTGNTWAPTRPVTISSYAENLLAPFLEEMKNRHVRVIFDYTPYLVYKTPGDEWKESETRFRQEIHRLGSELLEERDAFFYPNTFFFNSNLHLNEQGRQARTQVLIEALRKKLKLTATTTP
jgi:hypothetical protein